jgi:hypothetical protein
MAMAHPPFATPGHGQLLRLSLSGAAPACPRMARTAAGAAFHCTHFQTKTFIGRPGMIGSLVCTLVIGGGVHGSFANCHILPPL